jgi:hypothetical protein
MEGKGKEMVGPGRDRLLLTFVRISLRGYTPFSKDFRHDALPTIVTSAIK